MNVKSSLSREIWDKNVITAFAPGSAVVENKVVCHGISSFLIYTQKAGSKPYTKLELLEPALPEVLT